MDSQLNPVSPISLVSFLYSTHVFQIEKCGYEVSEI